MGKLFFISDLHFGHPAIPNFADWTKGMTLTEYEDLMITRYNSVVGKGDSVCILGDVATNNKGLIRIQELNGSKALVRGNHDRLSAFAYLNFFNNIYGMTRKKNMWLTHAPMNVESLAGRINIHGHVHMNSLSDKRFINVSACVLGGYPISYDQILAEVKSRGLEIK